MRQLTVKYAGECRKCGKTLKIGQQAIYERRVGLFCLECEPTDPEEIRAYRQEGADRKADRYAEWAAKRKKKANAVLDGHKRYTSDITFNTQPGHIPLRARIIKQEDRAFESLQKAADMQAKADSLRHVAVKGDAERRRHAVRDKIRPLLKIGMRVYTGIYGHGVIKRINPKTATIENCGTSKTYTTKVCLSWLRILE